MVVAEVAAIANAAVKAKGRTLPIYCSAMTLCGARALAEFLGMLEGCEPLTSPSPSPGSCDRRLVLSELFVISITTKNANLGWCDQGIFRNVDCSDSFGSGMLPLFTQCFS
jgi:hypothetical protein